MAKYKGVIVSQTNYHQLRDGLNIKAKAIRDTIISTLAYIGEECVRIAREDHPGNWGNRTGNLRSSIAYTVLNNGNPIGVQGGQFKTFSGPEGNGSAGQPAAETLLSKLQGRHRRGLVLIVCAGMHYAAYVEDIHHKVVLSEARQVAQKMVKDLLASFLK